MILLIFLNLEKLIDSEIVQDIQSEMSGQAKLF